MATVQKFEDLVAWQRARLLTREIYRSLNAETFKRLNRLSEDCSVLIYRFIQSVKQQNIAGHQYKKEKSKSQIEREKFGRVLAAYVQASRDNPSLDFEKFYLSR